MARLPEVPGLSELKAESSPGKTYIVGNIMPNRKFKWAVAAQCEMQLPQDSYWAGVLHRPYEIAGPLPWNDFNRHLHLRISREGRQKELAHGWPPCCSGLGDPITGRLYFMDGDVSVWEKSEDLDRSAAGLLMVRWGRGLRFTDGFRDAWGELFDRAAQALNERVDAARRRERELRARPPSPTPSVQSSSTEWEVIEMQGPTSSPPPPAPPPQARPVNPSPSMRRLMRENVRTSCEVCHEYFFGEPEPFVFEFCSFCGVRPSYHHGRCCPARQDRSGGAPGRRIRQRGRAALGLGLYRGDADNTSTTGESTWSTGAQAPQDDAGLEELVQNEAMEELDREVAAAERRHWLAYAKYCRLCEMWLNGEGQWNEHVIGRKHRRRIQRMEEERLHLARLRELAWAAEPEATIGIQRPTWPWWRRVQIQVLIMLLTVLGLLRRGSPLDTSGAATLGTVGGDLRLGAHSRDTLLHGLLVMLCLWMSWVAATAAPASN